MRPIVAMAGALLVMLGVVICFLNSGGLVIFLKLWKLKRRGVEGEAVSEGQEWISSGHRVHYYVRLPGAEPGAPPPRFSEVGPEPRGPVGTVVPVVYDRRNPRRARTGTLADIEEPYEFQWGGVKGFYGTGLACVAVGTVILLIFG